VAVRAPRSCLSKQNSEPTLQRHPVAPSRGLCQKSTLAQPINYSGSGAAISEQCEISQAAQIARLQIALYPGAREF
jgi:hypothetical protein